MKKIVISFLIVLTCSVAAVYALLGNMHKNKNSNESEGEINKYLFDENDSHWLTVDGTQLLNGKGENIQLKGVSSHGIQWYSEVVTYENLKQLKEEWNINVFRIAMYTNPKIGGYISDKDKNKEKVCKIVDMATELEMYVIIDWHTLSDNNPRTYEQESINFFDEMSKKYAENPYVIYEICNEPNGKSITWDECVKPYAEAVIPAIRKNSPKSLIIVGTPDWCKDLKPVADNPLDYNNVMYSCHFYAGSHGNNLKDSINYCLEKNVPVFISECGITDISGHGNIYQDDFVRWIDYLKQNNLSFIYWSFCSKGEESSILREDYPIKSDEEMEELRKNNVETKMENANMNDYLTESGNIVKKVMQ